jgi:hypothetical protein
MNDNGNLTAEDLTLAEGEIDWETWVDTYKPIPNHLTKYPSGQPFDTFETYGEELEFVQAQDPRYVWTEVQADSSMILVAGYAYVNRLNYFICKEPWTDEDLTVVISVDVECECYDEERWESGLDAGDPSCEHCEGYGHKTVYSEDFRKVA